MNNNLANKNFKIEDKKRKLPLGEIQNRVNNCTSQVTQPDVFKRLAASAPVAKKLKATTSGEIKSPERFKKEPKLISGAKKTIGPTPTPVITPKKQTPQSPPIQKNSASKIPTLSYEFPRSPLKLSPDRLSNQGGIAGGDGSLGRIRTRFSKMNNTSSPNVLSSPDRIMHQQSPSLKRNLLSDLLESHIAEGIATNSTPLIKSSMKQNATYNSALGNNQNKTKSFLNDVQVKKSVKFAIPDENLNDDTNNETTQPISSPPPLASSGKTLDGLVQDHQLKQKIIHKNEKENSFLESQDSNQELMKILLQVLKRQDQIDRKLDLLLNKN